MGFHYIKTENFCRFESWFGRPSFREDEKDAERISDYTDSYINVNETKYNQTLFLNEDEVETDESGRIKFTKKLRNEFTEMNVKRKSEGFRAKQKMPILERLRHCS